MIDKTIEKALNAQLNEEMNSFYIYLAMAASLDAADFTGMAKWMKAQAHEELAHAMKFYGYVNDRGGKIELGAMSQPKAEWGKPVDVFKAALAHERHITGCIAKLIDQADAAKEHATHAFLQWFVTEQVEEEATLEPIIRRLEMIGDSGAGLFMLDRELGQRA